MKSHTILAVDDEQLQLEIITGIIEAFSEPYRIMATVNPERAYRIALDEQPDVIITDWDMPGMDGIALIERLKSNPAVCDIPVLMYTGKMTDSANLYVALKSGAQDFLLKPVDGIELMARLHAMLTMSDYLKTIKAQKREIEAWNHELEDRVRERTRELEASRNQIQTINDQLVRANEELLKLDKLKSDFMTNITHELRTPLATIRGFAHLLKMYPDVGSKQVLDFAGKIYNDADKLTHLINEVLELSELDTGVINWRGESVYLPDLIKITMEKIEPRVAERSIRMEMTFDEPIPHVPGNSEKLQRALHNLVDNAVKFNNDGGYITVSVYQLTHEGRLWLRCEVADGGIGIPAEYQGVIFDRFRQVGDMLTSKPQGIGLGLPIAKEIIRHHGGGIGVLSHEGQGSRFYFEIPVESE